jgi:hypothetical protein
LLELRVDRPAPAQAALGPPALPAPCCTGGRCTCCPGTPRRPGPPARLLAEAGITVQSAAAPLSMEDVFVQRITALEAAQRGTP